MRQFLHIAFGSACKLEYYVLLARDLRIIPPKQFDAMQPRVAEVKRMLSGLIEHVNQAEVAPG